MKHGDVISVPIVMTHTYYGVTRPLFRTLIRMTIICRIGDGSDYVAYDPSTPDQHVVTRSALGLFTLKGLFQ